MHEVDFDSYNFKYSEFIDLLKQHNQEYILSVFVGVTINKMVVSPIRPDKTPSCKLCYNSDKILTLFDYAKGTSYNVFEIIKEYNNWTNRKTIIEICNAVFYHSINPVLKEIPVIKQIAKADIEVIYSEFTKQDLELFSTFDYQASASTLNKLGIRKVSGYYFGEKFINKPAIIFCLKSLEGFENTQIYRPDLFKDQEGIEGKYRARSSRGLYLFKNTRGNTITTKSFQDAYWLYLAGCNVRFVLSEGHKFTEDEIMYYDQDYDNTHFLLFDNDKSGRENAEKVKDTFKLIFYKEEGIKDSKDYAMKFGLTALKKKMNNVNKFNQET